MSLLPCSSQIFIWNLFISAKPHPSEFPSWRPGSEHVFILLHFFFKNISKLFFSEYIQKCVQIINVQLNLQNKCIVSPTSESRTRVLPTCGNHAIACSPPNPCNMLRNSVRWGFLHLCSSKMLVYSFFSYSISLQLWYQGKAGPIEWAGKFPLQFFGKVGEGLVLIPL